MVIKEFLLVRAVFFMPSITKLLKNEIGLQAKDGSKVFLYNNTMKDNRKALDAYKKNWRYDGGGEILVFKSVLTGNNETVSADKNSKITLYDSFVGGDVS